MQPATGTMQPGTPPPFGGTMAPAPAASGSKGLIIGLVVAGLVVIAGGVAVAVALGGEDPDPNAPPQEDPLAASGMVTAVIRAPDGGGELFVDGVSQGPVADGAQIPLSPGAHTLELRVAGSPFSTRQVTAVLGEAVSVPLNAATMNPTTPTTPTTPVANPAGGEVRQGTLAAGDATLQSGEFSDHYQFQWTQGQFVHIELSSSVFDTYVIVRGPSGGQHDNDDGPDSGTNSVLDVNVHETGTWTVIATSFRAGEQGAYTLQVSPR